MQTVQIPNTELRVSRLLYGCMGLGGSWSDAPLSEKSRKKALRAIRSALELGINFFDHADIYSRGKSEETFNSLWLETPQLRQQLVLQSKCGIRFDGEPRADSPGRYDFSYEHILAAVEGSLKRLGTNYLDILLLHRPDPLVEPEEVARAFDALHAQGKVRYFGVSNHTAAQIELLQHWINQPLVANQVEFSLLHSQLVDEGVVFNQVNPRIAMRSAGTLEYCRLHQISVQAWAPLAGGAVVGSGSAADYTGAASTQPEVIGKLQRRVAELAIVKKTSPEAIALAWIMRHPANIQPVVGTTNPERLRQACLADELELDREEWYSLFISGRGAGMP